jgi:hypothetical protein
MRSFRDSADTVWEVSLTVGAIKRVRGNLDVDLLALEQGHPPLITRIGTDVVLLCDIIYCLIKPQADKAGISDEQFGGRLGGEVIQNQSQVKVVELAVGRAEMRLEGLDLEKLVEDAVEGV